MKLLRRRRNPAPQPAEPARIESAIAPVLQLLIFSNTGLPEYEFNAQREKIRRVADYDSDTRSWYGQIPSTAPKGPPRFLAPCSRPPACTAPPSRCRPRRQRSTGTTVDRRRGRSRIVYPRRGRQPRETSAVAKISQCHTGDRCRFRRSWDFLSGEGLRSGSDMMAEMEHRPCVSSTRRSAGCARRDGCHGTLAERDEPAAAAAPAGNSRA